MRKRQRESALTKRGTERNRFSPYKNGTTRTTRSTWTQPPFKDGSGSREAFEHEKIRVFPGCATTDHRKVVLQANAIYSYDIRFSQKDRIALAQLYSEGFKSGTLKVFASTRTLSSWNKRGLVGLKQVKT